MNGVPVVSTEIAIYLAQSGPGIGFCVFPALFLIGSLAGGQDIVDFVHETTFEEAEVGVGSGLRSVPSLSVVERILILNFVRVVSLSGMVVIVLLAPGVHELEEKQEHTGSDGDVVPEIVMMHGRGSSGGRIEIDIAVEILVQAKPLEQTRFVLKETESRWKTVFVWEFGIDPRKVERGICNFYLREIKSR